MSKKHDDTRAVLKGQYKYSAKKRGLEFILTDYQFYRIIQQPCIYCGRSLTNSITWGTRRANSNTPRPDFRFTGIDRRDNSKGYTLQNSVPCCKICNYAKMDQSIEEFEAWLNDLVKFRQNL